MIPPSSAALGQAGLCICRTTPETPACHDMIEDEEEDSQTERQTKTVARKVCTLESGGDKVTVLALWSPCHTLPTLLLAG